VKACRGNGGIAPLILNFGARGRLWLMPRLVRITPGTHWIGCWMGFSAGLDVLEKKKCLVPVGIRTTNLPAHGWVYRMSYPGSCLQRWSLKMFNFNERFEIRPIVVLGLDRSVNRKREGKPLVRITVRLINRCHQESWRNAFWLLDVERGYDELLTLQILESKQLVKWLDQGFWIARQGMASFCSDRWSVSSDGCSRKWSMKNGVEDRIKLWQLTFLFARPESGA
jgi:hypothetical protein